MKTSKDPESGDITSPTVTFRLQKDKSTEPKTLKHVLSNMYALYSLKSDIWHED